MMKRRKSGRRMLSTLAGLTVLLAGVPFIAAENSRATHSGDPCGVQLQQVPADIASQPPIDPNIRAQVNEASAFCQQGEPEEAQRILDQVVQDMRTKPKTSTN
jgi:hypothetical protein